MKFKIELIVEVDDESSLHEAIQQLCDRSDITVRDISIEEVKHGQDNQRPT